MPEIIICGTDTPQGGIGPYYIGYSDLVDGYRHAWLDTSSRRPVMKRGRTANHPADPRCPECHHPEANRW
jgi:hypothetical protein